jgi:hypothetical protein
MSSLFRIVDPVMGYSAEKSSIVKLASFAEYFILFYDSDICGAAQAG